MLDFSYKKLRAVNYVIIAFILLAALLFTRNLISLSFNIKGPGASEENNRAKTSKIQGVKNIMSFAPVVEKNPFGPPMEFKPIAVEHPVTAGQGPISQLVLVGTVSGPEKLSYAIFEDKSQSHPFRQGVFAYGEKVYSYGTLTKIEKQWIELTRETGTYKINLKDIKDISAYKGNLHTSASHSRLAKKINEKQYMLNQSKIQEALNNPEKILSDARLYPNMKNGKQDGFRILEIKPGGLYQSLGLKNRDILHKVNGLELSSPEAAMQTMSALRGMNSVNLDIIRNGVKMTLNYQIK